jgi:hypothetical protein
MAQEDFNFMDLLEDDAWFEAAARREDSVTCETLAGNGWETHGGIDLPQAHIITALRINPGIPVHPRGVGATVGWSEPVASIARVY